MLNHNRFVQSIGVEKSNSLSNDDFTITMVAIFIFSIVQILTILDLLNGSTWLSKLTELKLVEN